MLMGSLVVLSYIMFLIRVRGLKFSMTVYTISLLSMLLINQLAFGKDIIIEWSVKKIIIGLLLGITLYLIEIILFYMFKYRVIILDITFFLKGKLNIAVALVSLFILILEELVWREMLFSDNNNIILKIILSSIAFGLCHIVFGKLQVVFKCLLSLLLIIAYLYTNDILVTVVIHASYNYCLLKKSGKGSKQWR